MLRNPETPTTVNMTWIGPPALSGGVHPVIGHDVIGPGLIAKANEQNNLLIFWCLKKFQRYYENKFSPLIRKNNFRVKTIESFLNQKVSNPFIQDLLEQVKEIINQSLYGKKHGSVRDRTFVKDIFNLSLLAIGDPDIAASMYAIDTNLLPKEGTKPTFPFYSKFRAPLLHAKVGEETLELWLFYSPEKYHGVTLFLLKQIINLWKKTIPSLCPTSWEYYKQLGRVMMDPLNAALNEGGIESWPVTYGWSTLSVDALQLEKIYCNVHHHTSTKTKFKKIDPVIDAAYMGQSTWLKGLLENGASLTGRVPHFMYDGMDYLYGNETALSVAMRYYQHKCVTVLVEAGANLDDVIEYEEVKKERPISIKELITLGLQFKLNPDILLPENPPKTLFRNIAMHAEFYQEILHRYAMLEITKSILNFYKTGQLNLLETIKNKIHAAKNISEIESIMNAIHTGKQKNNLSSSSNMLVTASIAGAGLFSTAATALSYPALAKGCMLSGTALCAGIFVTQERRAQKIAEISALAQEKLERSLQSERKEELETITTLRNRFGK